jgi:hypothetical protein
MDGADIHSAPYGPANTAGLSEPRLISLSSPAAEPVVAHFGPDTVEVISR